MNDDKFFNDPFRETMKTYNDWKKTEKTVERIAIGFVCLWIASIVLSIGLMGTVIYVAYHFLSKVW